MNTLVSLCLSFLSIVQNTVGSVQSSCCSTRYTDIRSVSERDRCDWLFSKVNELCKKWRSGETNKQNLTMAVKKHEAKPDKTNDDGINDSEDFALT